MLATGTSAMTLGLDDQRVVKVHVRGRGIDTTILVRAGVTTKRATANCGL